MKEAGKRPDRRKSKAMKKRRILEILILISVVFFGIMVTKLINTGIEAYRVAKVTPTPTPTPFVLVKRTPTPTITPVPTPGPVVMIDPGHGGNDVGATVGGKADVYEKTINLAIGLKVRDKLEELGFTVVMTREEDVYLSTGERLQAYKDSEATGFVSIHLNVFDDPSVSGCEVHYRGERNANSEFMAECILDGICGETGIRKRNVVDSNFEVLLSGKPSVLAECEYMSSETEYPKLKDDSYQDLIAQGIANGLVKYYKKMNGAD